MVLGRVEGYSAHGGGATIRTGRARRGGTPLLGWFASRSARALESGIPHQPPATGVLPMSTATPSKPAKKVARPKVRQNKMLINGQWVDSESGKTFPTFHPATEEKIADVARGSEKDIDRA